MPTSLDLAKSLSVSYRTGERIIAAGEVGACLFLVQSGSVRLSRRASADLAPLEIAVLERGDMFGEGALLEGRPYGVDAEAVNDCEILELSATTFRKMLLSHPEIGVRMLRQLSVRLERLEERLAAAPAATPTAEPTPAHAPGDPARAGRRRRARLVMEGGGVMFNLAGPEMLIGRYDPVTEVQPEIDLSPIDVKRSVSRRHARLLEKNGVWLISEETGAVNGTFVNNGKIAPGESKALVNGDVLALGMIRLIFRET